MNKEDFRAIIDRIDEAQNIIIGLVQSSTTTAKDKIKLKRIAIRLDYIEDIMFYYEPLK